MIGKFLPLACLLFIGGLGFIQLFSFGFDAFYIFLILLFLVVLSIAFWQNKKLKIVALLAAFFVLGVWRYQISQPIINDGHVAFYNDNQKISLAGQIVAEPDERENGTKLTVGHLVGNNKESLRGKILLSAENYPAYQYGDWLKFECQLKTPEKIEDFDYGKYLGVKGIYSLCYQPEDLTLVDGRLTVGQKIYRSILSAKKHYSNILNRAMIFPHSELLNGLVLGLRKGIPANIMQNFQAVGLTHIIAISGMNITIIAGLMINLFIALGLRRGRAFYAAVMGLILFLLMIGWQASAVRAGIMGFILLLAEKTGRLARATRALLISAVIILLLNPQALVGDVGFQLSFLAVLGIIYFDKPMEKFLTKLKVPEFLEIRSSLKMTLAAQILVLPILIYHFGTLSLISPLVNIVIVPLLPFITILGFIMILAGLIFMPLAILLGYVARIILSWILLVAEYAARLPGAGIGVKKFDFIFVVIIYMVLGWTIWIKKYTKQL
ncbi:ComEC family competence protein [Candidatus Kuenenbacteria bacterium]|nr:ComEC family competence protein [Candidatus Kuenenbacteria bacterium]